MYEHGLFIHSWKSKDSMKIVCFIFLYLNTNSIAWHIADAPEIGIE